MLVKTKMFDKMSLQDMADYSGMLIKGPLKKEEPSPASRTPEPEKRAVPRPVFR